jgi:hypothetical protein
VDAEAVWGDGRHCECVVIRDSRQGSSSGIRSRYNVQCIDRLGQIMTFNAPQQFARKSDVYKDRAADIIFTYAQLKVTEVTIAIRVIPNR